MLEPRGRALRPNRNLMFDLDQYLAVGLDAAMYFVLAIVSTFAYLLKLGLGFIGGDDPAGLEADGIDAQVDGVGTFSLFSSLSILAFLMGVGWMGLVSRVNWQFGGLLSACLGAGFGVGLLSGTAGMLYGLRRMAHVPRYQARSALGQTAKVYLTIPPKGQGQGQIEVAVSGRRKIMAAVSTADEIPAFAAARVVDVKKGNVFVVESGDVPRTKPVRGGPRG